MRKELDYLCKGFTKCGKDKVNDAVMQQTINYQGEVEDASNSESEEDSLTSY